MIKWISSILIILLGIVISIILYLSTVGIETKSFNNLIENKVKIDLLWNSLIFYFYNNKISVNLNEIDEQLKLYQNKKEFSKQITFFRWS